MSFMATGWQICRWLTARRIANMAPEYGALPVVSSDDEPCAIWCLTVVRMTLLPASKPAPRHV
jgi:hypothetical protein